MPRFPAPVVLCGLALFSFAAMAQAPTTTTVSSVPASAPAGSAVQISATVAPSGAPAETTTGAIARPTGTVQFLDGATPIGTAQSVLTPSSGFTTTPFTQVFGTLDPAFIDVSGQFAGDLNGDGVQDLMVYLNVEVGEQPQTDLEVQSFLSRAGGGYTTVSAQKLASPVTPPANTPITFVPALADLNGDGKADILIGPAVAYGNGDGTFQQPVTLPFLATGFVYTYAVDVTGDGKPDIVAINLAQNLTATATVPLQMTVFVNMGGGAFQASGTFTIATGQCPCIMPPFAQLAFADLNGDGLPDVVAQDLYVEPEGTMPQAFSALLNSGSGSFATALPIAFTPQDTTDHDTSSLLTMQIADFNRDGKLDIALAYPSNGLVTGAATTIVFLPGNNDGTFGAQMNSTATYPMPTQQNPSFLAANGNVVATDANLDGNPDLVFGTSAVAIGDGRGNFSGDGAIGNQLAQFADSISLLQLAGSELPSLVFAGNPAGAGAASTSYVASPDLASTATITPILGVGTHTITAKYSGDTDYAASIAPASMVNITQVATVSTLTSTANPAYRGVTATITVSVRSSAGVPTGTVAFSCGPAPMSGLSCPATLSLDAQGNATFQAANSGSLTGSLMITAAYSGDANHASSTAQFSQVFEDPVKISPSTGTITVKSGQSASTQFSVTGNAGFTGPADLACTGLPANASCVFNPTLTNLTATAQTATLTLSTSATPTAAVKPLFGPGSKALLCSFFAGSLLLLRRRRGWTHWIGIAVIGLGLLPLGCGGNNSSGGGGSSNVAPGTYPFTVSTNNAGQEAGPQFVLVVQ